MPAPVSPHRGSDLVLWVLCCCCCCLVSWQHPVLASQAAGTETLVGIVGRDFVLLGADSSVSRGGYALTASNLDKIATLVEPFPSEADADDARRGGRDARGGGGGDSPTGDGDSPTGDGGESQGRTDRASRKGGRRQQTIVAAAAGDAADSDRLIGEMVAQAAVEEYQNGWGCDVRFVSAPVATAGDGETDDAMLHSMVQPGMDVEAAAHMARGRIAAALRSRTPLRVCLLVAGMMLVGDDNDDDNDKASNGGDGVIIKRDYSELAEADATIIRSANFVSSQVQEQVQQAWNPLEKTESPPTSSPLPSGVTNSVLSEPPTSPYKPRLYWLDEYGSLQRIQYGAHGYGSNFSLSILDRGYRPDMTRAQAVQLMKECFEQLRSRYLINSPQDPCIKCVDMKGVRWITPVSME